MIFRQQPFDQLQGGPGAGVVHGHFIRTADFPETDPFYAGREY
jgi:hypothetical protein